MAQSWKEPSSTWQFALGRISPQSIALNLLLVVFGLALGWLLGILVSPYSSREAKKCSEYAKVLGVFVSGYLVAKIDPVIAALFNPTFVLDFIPGFRLIAFLVSLTIGLLITFVFRQYS
ncbi:hypothetical protein L0128_11275 [candidate division KSB1 bacterium]|nr:hypothetical protein [candidate division KSB1 bacterium]